MRNLFLTNGQMLIVDIFVHETKQKTTRKLLVVSVDVECLEIIEVFDIEAQRKMPYFLNELGDDDFTKQLLSGSTVAKVEKKKTFTYTLFS